MKEELEEMIEHQKKVLYKRALELEPHITEEDILQPFDFPSLEKDPLFRYEEGILCGLLRAQIILKFVAPF